MSFYTTLLLIVAVVFGGCGPTAVYNAIPGPSGAPGASGHSVVFSSLPAPLCAAGGNILMFATDANDNGVLDAADTHIMTATVCNGSNGSNGTNGADAAPTQFTPVGVLNPCGANTAYDEVLLKLASGQVLASFSQSASGQNTRFSLLVADTGYVTTDADLCYFKIDSTGALYDEHH